MASNLEKSSLFPLLFADLMMGAAAIIIVSLIFLKIVADKGVGEFDAEDVIALPPGLLDNDTMPVVRVRILECARSVNGPAISVSLSTTRTPSASGTSKTCSLSHYKFETGLRDQTLELRGGENVGRRSVWITIFVGGYQASPVFLQDIDINMGQLIGTISFNDPKNIWRQS